MTSKPITKDETLRYIATMIPNTPWGRLAAAAVDEDEKPPLGLKPKYIHEYLRANDIILASARYVNAGKSIPREWLLELAELIR